MLQRRGDVALRPVSTLIYDARQLYSIAAAVHAWVEFPVLLLALAIPAEEKIII